MRSFVSAGAAVVCALTVSGCAQLKEWIAPLVAAPAPVTTTTAVAPALPALPKPFVLSGRVSIAWDAQRWIGAIEWDYAPAIESLSLSLAGQDFARFERYEGRARAQLASGQTFEENSWSDLTVRAIGVALPFELAPYWVRGETAPQVVVSERAENVFTQKEWVVSTLERDASGRPTRMRWQKDKVSLTLVIDAWTPER
jgi:outer membrane biogenesis lipoprotein LolB